MTTRPPIKGRLLAYVVCGRCQEVVAWVDLREDGPHLVYEDPDKVVVILDTDRREVGHRMEPRTFADPLDDPKFTQHDYNRILTCQRRDCGGQLQVWPNRPEFRGPLDWAQAEEGRVARLRVTPLGL